MKKTVLGCLPYLNVKPLIRSIERDVPEGYELIYDTPSGLAERLQEGTCDIAAVSSFEAMRNPDLVILPGSGIGSDGIVTSVMLFSKVRPELITSVALDTSSLSGAALTRIVLDELYDVRPEFFRHGPDAESMLAAADCCLLIGNNAMNRAPEVPYIVDLGEAWKELTGLPFVFGLWTGRDGAVEERDVRILLQAKMEGLAEIEEMAVEESQSMGLPVAVVRRYLAEIMIYDLGPRQLLGLQMFCEKAQAHGLLDETAGVRLWSGFAADIRR